MDLLVREGRGEMTGGEGKGRRRREGRDLFLRRGEGREERGVED